MNISSLACVIVFSCKLSCLCLSAAAMHFTLIQN